MKCFFEKFHKTLLLLVILTVFTEISNGRYHGTRELLRQLLERKDDLYYGGDDNEPSISADDLPQIGELFEGDIVMDEDLKNTVLGHNKRSAVAAAELGHRKHWPGGVVPYLLDDSLKPIVRSQIIKAISEFHKCTCVSFVPKTDEDKNYVVFKDGKGCSSSVGRKGGEQSIHLAYGCKRIGTVMHEMMHSLGIIHEQSRSDRDEFIKVRYENIKKDLVHNFRKYDYLESRNMDIPYNYNSVMHYSNTAFSKNDKRTLESKVDPELKFGQRKQLTHYDLKQIAHLYPCPAYSSKHDQCFDEEDGYNFVSDMTPEDAVERKRDTEDLLEKLLERY